MTLKMNSAAEELNDSERASLIQDLARAFNLERFNKSGWLLLWFSDIESLRRILLLVDMDEVNKEAWRAYFHPEDEMFDKLIETWMRGANDSRSEYRSATSESDSETDEQQISTELYDLCTQRDGRCILTNTGDLLVTSSIIPPTLAPQNTSTDTFWGLLRLFWSKAQVASWRKAAEDGYNTLANYICMASQVDGYWELSRIALKPIARTEDTFTLQFFWISSPVEDEEDEREGIISVLSQLFPPDIDCEISRLTKQVDSGALGFLDEQKALSDISTLSGLPMVFASFNETPKASYGVSLLDRSPKGGKLFDCSDDQKICSGRFITLHTENSKAHPLPSWDLMHMQWIFQRIAGLRYGEGDLD